VVTTTAAFGGHGVRGEALTVVERAGTPLFLTKCQEKKGDERNK